MSIDVEGEEKKSANVIMSKGELLSQLLIHMTNYQVLPIQRDFLFKTVRCISLNLSISTNYRYKIKLLLEFLSHIQRCKWEWLIISLSQRTRPHFFNQSLFLNFLTFFSLSHFLEQFPTTHSPVSNGFHPLILPLLFSSSSRSIEFLCL